MKKVFFLSFFIFFAIPFYAQFLDTLHNAFNGTKTFDFRYESRNSFINHDRLEVQSLKIGATFGKKISIGGGYSWLKTLFYDKYKFTDSETKRDTVVYRRMKLNYMCYYVDYIFYKSKRWQYSIPTQFGIGNALFLYDYKGNHFQEKAWLFLYEPEVNVKYKIFTWLGLGANVAYRIVVKNNKHISNKLNSPIYSGGIIIYWDQLALAIFPKNKLVNKWLGPVEW